MTKIVCMPLAATPGKEGRDVIAETDRRALVAAGARALLRPLAPLMRLGPTLALRALLARLGGTAFGALLARLLLLARRARLAMLRRLAMLAGLRRLARLLRLARRAGLSRFARLALRAARLVASGAGTAAAAAATTAASIAFLEGDRLHARNLDARNRRADQLLDRLDQAAFGRRRQGE